VLSQTVETTRASTYQYTAERSDDGREHDQGRHYQEEPEQRQEEGNGLVQ
jgi:hypothetical protein